MSKGYLLAIAPPFSGWSLFSRLQTASWRHALILFAAALIGLWIWPLAEIALPLAAMEMMAFALGRLSRLWGYLAFAVFYLVSSSPLIFAGGAVMNAGLLLGVAGWLVLGLLSSLPILLLRGKAPGIRAAVVALLYIVPPFGSLAPNNPAVLIGLFFPGTGIAGAIGFMAVAGLVGSFTARKRSHVGFLALLLALSVTSNAMALFSKRVVPSNWHALSTTVGNHGDNMERRIDVSNLQLPATLKAALTGEPGSHDGEIWFMAEGMIYDWTPATDFFWRRELDGSGVTAVAGGYEYNEKSRDLTSRLYALGDLASHSPNKVAIDSAHASVTFPMVMWRPWGRPNHFPMHTPNDIVLLDGQRVHFSWCFESNIVWPHVFAAWRSADVMVSLENRWTYRGTSLESAQTMAGALNARWLGVPILRAINR